MKTHLVAAAALSAFVLSATPLLAQGINSKEAIDAIVGSKVEEEAAKAATDADRVIAAIDHTTEATAAIRKATKLAKVEIVYLTDASATEGGPPPAIASKIEEKKAEIGELRKELEGNAMLFHAIDSRQILIGDVLAVSFDGTETATIYAAARPGG
ncbi:MAG: hypothetical protein J0H34_14225 [Rhizobiales bacterium]|nr:hypothetical protein [Hyphomicrobiales bacterium]